LLATYFQDSNIDKTLIGKVIVVSSTGFLGPGLDCHIIQKLGLPEDCERSNIGFMGCAAAMNGLQVATDYAKCHPDKKALMVCLELSSVHGAFGDNINDVIIHALFADGCAAVIVGCCTQKESGAKIVVLDKSSVLTANSQDGIVLDICNTGITCTLSKDLPKYIESNMASYVDNLLKRNGFSRSDVDLWAAHPGGTRILEAVHKSLQLTKEQLADSWEILNNYGNMLSPSVLYVIQRHWERKKASKKSSDKGYELGIAFSFSPGVGIEGFLFKLML